MFGCSANKIGGVHQKSGFHQDMWNLSIQFYGLFGQPKSVAFTVKYATSDMRHVSPSRIGSSASKRRGYKKPETMGFNGNGNNA